MQVPALPEQKATHYFVASGSRVSERLASASSPFVLGVTGHRNLAQDDLARARQAAASFLDTIRVLLPDTELKIILGMAAGGDLVVAEIALELGIRVEAVLPMPLAEFIADFDELNLRLLKKLLAHPNLHYTELPVPAYDANSNLPHTTSWREAAYRDLRELLIRNSNLMLALWDGKVSPRPGSTADTVLRYLKVRTNENKHALHLNFAPFDSSANTDSPFVYWMPIAPGGNDASVAATPPCFLTGLGDTILKSGSQPPDALRRRLEDMNDYNRDFRRVAAEVRAAPSDSLLAGVPANLQLDDRATLERICTEYDKADMLALHYQKRSDRLFGTFGVFAFVMGCLYLIYDKLGENQGLLLVYLMILLGSLVLYRLLYSKVWFVKHLRYRALAETLRVRFYFCFAGIDRSNDSLEILALSGIEHFDGFGWIGYVLKNVAPTLSEPAPELDARRTGFVRKAWVENQFQYFCRKVKQLEQRSRRVSQGQLAAVAITVLALLLRMLFAQSMRSVYVLPDVPLKNLLMLGAGIMVLFLGAWKLHQSKMATRELIWQYKNQLALFSRSCAELDQTAMPSRRAELLVELGKRSLMESYLWTIHRYHREHAPPAGG
jgi:hypothetical protein